MITNYKKTKEDVLKAYAAFLPIVEKVKDGKETSYDVSLKSLQKQAENIQQDKFLLMVVGEAKSGKSTFINAYLGEEILPMDVKQLIKFPCLRSLMSFPRCGSITTL